MNKSRILKAVIMLIDIALVIHTKRKKQKQDNK